MILTHHKRVCGLLAYPRHVHNHEISTPCLLCKPLLDSGDAVCGVYQVGIIHKPIKAAPEFGGSCKLGFGYACAVYLCVHVCLYRNSKEYSMHAHVIFNSRWEQ